ncbi:MAG TPA: CarD family transcriptional regulator [Gaiellaceae bacterium]|nr:CarD family transcriptional regulator [Gaiellaceae bacterium]
MRLSVGDAVVYGTHGIGRIVAREEREVLGARREVVVVELAGGLTATLPLERAKEHLRPLASKDVIRKVQETLRTDRTLRSDPWLSRRREALEKLAAGDPVQLAEIVREGAQREKMRRGNGGKSGLSPGERDLFTRAWKLLAGEIASARGIDVAEADRWIEEQLASAE